MKIYTKTGDDGETGLFGGTRVSKSSARVRAYGEVDELNSAIGLARVEPLDARVDERLASIQSDLFVLGAELASKAGKELGMPMVGADEVAALERAIDAAETELEPLRSFVLPGGCATAARLHLARSICRRAERDVVALRGDADVRPEIVHYLNRLSDLLFVLARLANRRTGVEDVPWSGRAG